MQIFVWNMGWDEKKKYSAQMVDWSWLLPAAVYGNQ